MPMLRSTVCDALVGVFFEEFRGDEFFEGEDDAVAAADPDCCAPVLDRFDSVFDLEVAAVGARRRCSRGRSRCL